MALILANFKEAGGVGNSQDGGQLYTVFSTTDTLTAMMVSGYLDGLNGTLNSRDLIILTGTDGGQLVQIVNTLGVITVLSLNIASAAQSISGPGAIDIVSPTTEITTTGADAYTLADGAIGQRKSIVLIVDGGDATLTPANALGFSTIVFSIPGNSVQLEFRVGGWALLGTGGIQATTPVVA